VNGNEPVEAHVSPSEHDTEPERSRDRPVGSFVATNSRSLTGGSPHTPGAKLPARCMGLCEVNPWSGRVEYERADIEPYLLPPVDDG
jgi:hypothetical protein